MIKHLLFTLLCSLHIASAEEIDYNTGRILDMPQAMWNRHVLKPDREVIKELTLYNLNQNIGEQKNVAKENPEIGEKLMKHIGAIKTDLEHHEKLGINA